MIHKIITKNGYDFFECSSALQKSIRRGMEDEALFWAVEFSVSNFNEYVWKRLRIISSEDVGLADPGISSEIMALYNMYKEQLKKKDEKHYPERLFIIHAVIMLCRAKKSRLVDWQTCYAFGCHQNRLRVVPDFAFDKHTEKGKKMGRGMAHFIDEGCMLENAVILPGELKSIENAKRYFSGHCGEDLFD